MKRKIITVCVAGTLAMLGIAAAVVTLGSDPECEFNHLRSEVVIPCPGEDSCTADYRDGAWHIEMR